MRRRRQCIFEVEDEIMEKRDQLIDELEKRLNQRTVLWTFEYCKLNEPAGHL